MPRKPAAAADTPDEWADLAHTEGDFAPIPRPVPPAILAQAKTLIDSHKVQFDVHDRDAKYRRDLKAHMLNAVKQLAPDVRAQAKLGVVGGRQHLRFTTPRKTAE